MKKTNLFTIALDMLKEISVVLSFVGKHLSISKATTLSLLLSAIVLFAGCTKEKDEAETRNDNNNSKEVSVNPNYVKIDWNDATLLSSDDSTGTYQIQFNSQMPDIHPGSIITIDYDTVVRYIFVKTIDANGNTASVTSTEAYLTDIFSNTEFTLATSKPAKSSAKGAMFYPIKAYVIEENGIYETLNINKPGKGDTRFTHNLWQFDYNNDGQILFSGNNYKIYMEQMNLDLSLDIEMTMNFGDRTIHDVVDAIDRYRSNALSLNAALVGSFSTKQYVRCDIQGTCNYSPEYDLWKHNLLRPLSIRFVVNGVPIVITLRSDMFRQIELSAKGEISAYTGFSDKSEGRLGFKWQQSSNLDPMASLTNAFEFTPPTIEGQGQIQAKVWAFPRVSVMLYDVVGPSFDFKPYLADTVRGGFREQMLGQSNDYCAWSLDHHAGIDACCGLSLRFFGYEIENYSTPNWNIVDKRLYHSPKRIEHKSGRPAVGESQTVSFRVYDQNLLFNREVLTPLPQIVKFEAEGDLSSEYGIARDGIVSVTWKPASSDILYAKLYDANGNVLSYESVTLSGEDELSDDWVDLGLPSGLLWATRNVGASSPEDYGDYFAWGETRPKSVYNWDTYKYCNGGYNQLSKYCNESDYGYNGFIDNLTTLQASDDAATATLGGGARTPTMEEWEELLNNCNITWITQNSVDGYCVTGRNGGILFLPAAGYREDSELKDNGDDFHYWSSSLDTHFSYMAKSFSISLSSAYSDESRYNGFSVRPVRSAH